MLNSFYSGVSGMKGFQTKLDVIGNNIANVNTTGFKKSRVVFQDALNKNLSNAYAADDPHRGGLNPKQIGLGTKIASMDTVHTPGSPVSTNIGTDLSIDGDAYFVIAPDGGDLDTNYLTKAGNFTLDPNGMLVNANGNFVVGTTIAVDGITPVPQKIMIKEDQVNLSVAVPPAPLKFTSFSFDTNGEIDVVREDGQSGKLAIDGTGNYYMATAPTDEIISIATKVVPNPAGLQKMGNTMFKETVNSGDNISIDRIANNNGGQINAGVLEMSNVDLTDEFTEMIIAQRGFQANAKTITTSDTVMDEIINLKR